MYQQIKTGLRIIITILCTFLLCTSANSYHAPEKAIPLYPNGVPNSKQTPASYKETDDSGWSKYVSIPTITPYFPEKGTANGSAIIIFPGGGYGGLSMEQEGYMVAEEFNAIGITAFVVKYRLPSDEIMLDKSIGPLQDAQQAILTVRKHAPEWGIKPDKIGIIGFSAGGHLASTEGTHFDKALIDNKENISLRPDFMMLIYPVVTFDSALTHMGSRNNLLGKAPSRAQIELYSNEKHVTGNTPPTFLVHTADDKLVPVQNSLLFFDSLLSRKVKVEMHVLQAGGHGFIVNNPKARDQWFALCKSWLQNNGY